jgi:transcriptional regulator with XRE-family HTH domain
MNEVFLGHRLRRLRGDMTAKDLEDISGVAQGDISKLENGKKKRPSYLTVKRLADAFGVDPNYFYDEEVQLPEEVFIIPHELKEVIKKNNFEYLQVIKEADKHKIPAHVLRDIIRVHLAVNSK